MALQSAGTTGGSAGSPSPVGGLSVIRKFHIDRRRLIDPQRLDAIEVRLHHAAAVQRDRLAERRTEPVERRALHLIFGAARIDDLAADIADHPDVVELDLA